jgi:multidrug efflux pump subunit AcrA (membrane-fusion protein)
MTSSSGSRRRWLPRVLFGLGVLIIGVVLRRPLLVWFGGESMGEPAGAAVAAHAGADTPGARGMEGGSEAIDHYTCSMHPSVHQPGPGKCPICGMDLIPISKAQQEQGVVLIDEARRQLIGVRTGQVVLAPWSHAFRAVGQVVVDESALTDVNLKVRGWITKLLVNQTGQRVTAGQTLFSLYSPELYNAEQDFLLAIQSRAPTSVGGGTPNRADSLGRAARQRLHLLGLSETQIETLQRTGRASESIGVASPASGFVMEKNVVEGASVEAGMRLFRIAALDEVWVEAEVYEADLEQVHLGQRATVTLDYVPGRAYESKVSYIQPFLDPIARTARVRIQLANPKLELRPGMYASVLLASNASPGLQVPAAAVVYTGPRRLVFIDLGEGRFKPQEIRVGREGNGMYEVLAGLEPGERVATSGVFLIAAEARISTAARYWEKAPDEFELGASDANVPVLADVGSNQTTRSEAPAPSRKGPAKERPQGSLPTGSAATLPPKESASAPSTTDAVFSCPMHPEVRSPTPGKCPRCGMALRPAPSGGSK